MDRKFSILPGTENKPGLDLLVLTIISNIYHLCALQISWLITKTIIALVRNSSHYNFLKKHPALSLEVWKIQSDFLHGKDKSNIWIASTRSQRCLRRAGFAMACCKSYGAVQGQDADYSISWAFKYFLFAIDDLLQIWDCYNIYKVVSHAFRSGRKKSAVL